MVIYSPSFFFVAVAAIILLLYFMIFLAHNNFISTIIVGIRVVVGLKKLGLRLRLRIIYIFFTAIRPIKCS